jgi:hypothetical protein
MEIMEILSREKWEKSKVKTIHSESLTWMELASTIDNYQIS